MLDARGDEPVPVPSWHYSIGDAARDGTMPLRDALVQCYDIRFSFILHITLSAVIVHETPVPAEAHFKMLGTLRGLHVSPDAAR